MLGPWLEMAKDLGRNDEEKALYEYNARNQVSMATRITRLTHLTVTNKSFIPDNSLGTERRDFGLRRKAVVGPLQRILHAEANIKCRLALTATIKNLNHVAGGYYSSLPSSPA